MDLHKVQVELIEALLYDDSKVYYDIRGGGRSGKSMAALHYMYYRAITIPRSNHIAARRYLTNARSSLIITMDNMLSFMEQTEGKDYSYNKAEGKYTFPNKSTITIEGLDDKKKIDKILGREFLTFYLNEASEIDDYDVFQTLRTRMVKQRQSGILHPIKFLIDYNPPDIEHWLYKRFDLNQMPDGTPISQEEEDKTFHILMNPVDNPFVEGYIEEIMQLDERYQQRFIHGKFTAVPGGIFDASCIRHLINDNKEEVQFYREDFQIEEVPYRIISVDPAVKQKITSDNTGIIVLAEYHKEELKIKNNFGDQELYVLLEDATMKGDIYDLATEIVRLSKYWQVHEIFIEDNQGGTWLGNVIKRDANYQALPYPPKIVEQSVGVAKEERAFPVSKYYKDGRVIHNNSFEIKKCELEMIAFNPRDKTRKKSPDRMDALCNGLLHMSGFKETKKWR